MSIIRSNLLMSAANAPVLQTFSTAEANSTSVVVTKPTGTVDGDLLVVIMGSDGAVANHGHPGGWTAIFEDQSQANTINGSCWWKIASSEPANYTFTSDISEDIGIAVLRIDGHRSDVPINASLVETSTAGSGGGMLIDSINPTIQNCLMISAIIYDVTGRVTPPASMAEIYDFDTTGGGGGIVCAGAQEDLIANGATGDKTFDHGVGSASFIGFNIAIRPRGV